MKTNLILALSAVLVITAGVSLEVFMNSLGQNSIPAVRYPKTQIAEDNDVGVAYDFDGQIETDN
ncbi:MAG TPA: hypothetical protein VH415_10910 [Nitrososphaeraceae archaeon]|jgi:hypothetical protein